MRPAGDLITVCIVDDHDFFRDGLSRGLAKYGRIRVVGEADNGAAGLQLIRDHQPDVAVVDYQMPVMDGVELTRIATRDHLPTKILLLSAVTDGAVVFKALEEGASGYLAKTATRAAIEAAVVDVAAGRKVVPPELAASLVDQIRRRADRQAPILTERERQVLHGFARGLNIPALAKELFLEPSTIKSHTQHLYEKLGVSDRAAAVATAMREGLLE